MEAVFIDMVSFFLQHGKVDTEYLVDILIAKDTRQVACADADNETIQKTVLADERSAKYIEGDVLKVIIVPKRMVNIVFKK